MPEAVVHGETHRPWWVGGSDPDTPVGYYEYKLYLDAGHPAALVSPALSIVAVGLAQFVIEIPEDLDGSRLVKAHAFVTTPGAVTVMLRRLRTGFPTVSMLSTAITIDTADLSSYDAAAPYVINPANSEVLTGDQIATDVTAADGTAAGLGVTFVVAAV